MKITTWRLLINLGASRARKRLKGHGFGVKRIETAGKGRAVITHTATGRHLDELRALLSDVIDVASEETASEDPANS